MSDWTPTGSNEDLDSILRDEYACTRAWEAWQVGTMTEADFTPMAETEIVGDLLAWRDAAVARHLSEAGAVHPAVHTPTRVMQWLERHGWVRFNVSDVAILWSHPDVPTARGWSLCMPMTTEAADYSYRVLELVRELWRTSQSLEAEILLEIASMPGEVAW